MRWTALLLVLALALVGCADPPGTPPTVTSMLPLVGASLPLGLDVRVQAQAAPGAGGPVIAVRWSSDRDGDLGAAEPDADGIAATSVRFASVGEHVLTAEAVDRLGGAAADTVTVRVRTATAPFLTVTSPWSSGTWFADSVLLAAEVEDVEHPATDLRVTWTQDGAPLLADLVPSEDGTVSQTVTTTQGTHSYEARVVDPDGQASAATVTVTVGPPNTAPTCAILTPDDPAERHLGSTVRFVIALDDAETPDAVTWTLSSHLDGALATGEGAAEDEEALSPLSDDGHLVTLTVEDGYGGLCVDTVAVTMRDCDLDDDGAIATACAGRDCADGDPSVGPLVGDLAGDGIDGDCDGMDCGAGFAPSGAYFAACLPVLDAADSHEACLAAGYDGLASIRDAAEGTFVGDLGAPFSGARFWLGLHNVSGAWWSWRDGHSGPYQPWIPGQPDLGTFPACAEITWAGGWSDLPCSATYLNLGMVCALRP